MASADEVYLTVRGQGGHAAAPARADRPGPGAGARPDRAPGRRSRGNRPPGVPSILSFGRVEADGATNIIPDEVPLIGTFRSMDEEWRFRAHDLIRRTAEKTAEAFGATCEVEIVVGYPALTNDPRLRRFRPRGGRGLRRRRARGGPADVVRLARTSRGTPQQIPGALLRPRRRATRPTASRTASTLRASPSTRRPCDGAGFMAALALRHGVETASAERTD